MFVAKKKQNTFMPRARLFRYGRLFEFELFIMDSWFFLSLLILIKLNCDFLKRGLAQLVATISPTNTTHFHYYTIYIFSSNLHKVSCLLERVLVILHNINGILGFVRDISTCKIYIYMVIIVKCIFYTVIDTCTWKQ